jgi:hypothetical protein
LTITHDEGGETMRLIPALDFDGTMADTILKKSRNRIGVNEAYRMAVEKMLGSKGRRLFDKIGGLSNRAPMELILALADGGANFVSDFTEAAEKLVRFKLDILLQEIGHDWPKPCEGFCEAIIKMKQDGIIENYSILSSGHEEFIRNTLAIWKKNWPELPEPLAILSDDDVRNLGIHPTRKSKPSPFLITFLNEKLRSLGEGPVNFYFGDDPEKDGRLAMLTNIPFGWFSADKSKSPPPEVIPFIKFDNWMHIIKKLPI